MSLFAQAPATQLRLATAGTLAVLVMTAIHHIYGAWLFATPWRLHIVYISIPVAIAILAALMVGRANASQFSARVASWIYFALAGGFAVGAIGFYEGGYNHLLPNIQYVLGVEHTLRDGLYEPPDDLIFQLTGIAQFAAGLFAGWHLVKLATPRWRRCGSRA